tara:strand:+ start:251 stop:526 length:276 start_codon:yes stop_codon:yes gene_type:complete
MLINLLEKQPRPIERRLCDVLEDYQAFYIEDHHLIVIEQSDDTLAVIAPREEITFTSYGSLTALSSDFDLDNNTPVTPISDIGIEYTKAGE